MSRLLDMLRNEPAVVRGFVTAVAGLIVAYGLAEAERVDLWVTAILALLPIVSGLATRPAVTPNRQVAVRLDDRDGAVTGEALPPEGQPVGMDTATTGGATSLKSMAVWTDAGGALHTATPEDLAAREPVRTLTEAALPDNWRQD